MTPLKFFILLCSLFLVGCIAAVLYVNSVVAYNMPSLEQLENPKQNLATRIYSRDGKLLDHFYKERRVTLPYDSIPEDFIFALVATEDKEFFNHWGIHTQRMFNAVVKNVLYDRLEGASTISIQLAENLFLSRTKNVEDKIREIVVALQIEERYTKEEILQLYANTVDFGRSAFGIEVAAQVYFDKMPKDMTTAQCALLVAMLKAPSRYSPFNHPERAIRRRNLVLRLMKQEGYLSDAEYRKATEEPLNVFATDKKSQSRRTVISDMAAPHFVEMIRQALSKDNTFKINYNLYDDGLIIHTTIDSRIQKYANAAVEGHLKGLQKKFDQNWNWKYHDDILNDLVSKAIRQNAVYQSAADNEKKSVANMLRKDNKFVDSVKKAATTIQAGLVVIDPSNGAILAMVGASPRFMEMNPYAKYSLNHVTQAFRQPGSAFKPFVYTKALENGYNPQTMVECGPFTYELPTGEFWSPRGTGSCEEGEKRTLESALQWSINTVAARLVTSITNPNEVVRKLRRMGVSSKLQAVPAIALGAGGDVNLLELTSSFGTFANNGIHMPPFFYERIDDHFGTLILDSPKSRDISEAISPEISVQMIYMMEKVVNGGTARYAIREVFKDIDAAGKTGTTNDAADAWFIGYTPQLVAGVWVGFDDKRINFDVLGSQGYGGRAAAPVWGLVMDKIYSDASLPYKQKQFSYKIIRDTSMVSTIPYTLTEKQILMRDSLLKEESQWPPTIEPSDRIPGFNDFNNLRKDSQGNLND